MTADPERAVLRNQERVVRLRQEIDGADRRFLDARLTADGSLQIAGQDLGPSTPDGDEYEWFHTIAPKDIPRLVALLGGEPASEVLDLLETSWTGARSYELERRLRESDIDYDRFVC